MTTPSLPQAVLTDAELLPCPFCGSDPVIQEVLERYKATAESPAGQYTAGYRIECQKCGGASCCDEYESDLISAWNTRAALSRMGGESVPAGWRAGVEAVAALIQKKADDFAQQFGHDDMGGLSFGSGWPAEVKMDHHSNLCELAEEIRALATPTAPAQQAASVKPDAPDFELWWADKYPGLTQREARAVWAARFTVAQQAADVQGEPEKYQPCGCVLCTCQDEAQCHGCGAKFCERHDVNKTRAAAQSVPKGRADLHAKVEDLFGRYWDIAYDEARNGINLAHKANGVLHELRTLLAASAPTVGGDMPPELFDGYRVLKMLTHREAKFTSPENVSAVLDAVVKLIRIRQQQEAAQEPSAADALLHRLWLEGGGNADLKPGEVTEQNVADLLDGLNKLAEETSAAAEPVKGDTLGFGLSSIGRDGGHYERPAKTYAPPTPPSAPAAPSEPPPLDSLPSWDECALRVANSNHVEKRVREGGHGADHDVKLANDLHRFIYEYEDEEPYRAAWFRHRLELALAAAPAGAGEGGPLTDAQIIERCNAAGVRWIAPDDDPDGYPGGFDMSSLTEMRKLLSAAPPSHEGEDARDAALTKVREHFARNGDLLFWGSAVVREIDAITDAARAGGSQ